MLVRRLAIIAGLPLILALGLQSARAENRPDGTQTSVCLMLEAAARAQGIAQFMPGTAAERALLDPFDPVQALPKAAEFLQQLRRRFGNLGLAAAAYNAGPRRVQDWLNGAGGIPQETRNYVLAISPADRSRTGLQRRSTPGRRGQ